MSHHANILFVVLLAYSCQRPSLYCYVCTAIFVLLCLYCHLCTACLQLSEAIFSKDAGPDYATVRGTYLLLAELTLHRPYCTRQIARPDATLAANTRPDATLSANTRPDATLAANTAVAEPQQGGDGDTFSG